MKLENRTILITGGTSGIGRELAKQLLAKGNTVLITGRNQQKLDETKQALPGIHAFKSDVSDPADIQTLHASVLKQFPALDILINNAGIMRNLNLSDARGLNDVTQEVEINLNGPIRMVQQFLTHLKNRKEALILNVSSGLAFIPFPLSPIYSATKAGVHAFVQILRIQLADTNVKVIELAPPGTETKLFRGEFQKEMKGQKAMPVAVLAKRAIDGIEAGKSEIRPGLSNVLYWMRRIAPEFMLAQLVKMTKPKS